MQEVRVVAIACNLGNKGDPLRSAHNQSTVRCWQHSQCSRSKTCLIRICRLGRYGSPASWPRGLASIRWSSCFINSATLSGISSRNTLKWNLRNSAPMPLRTAFRSADDKSRAMPTNANPCAVFLAPHSSRPACCKDFRGCQKPATARPQVRSSMSKRRRLIELSALVWNVPESPT
jgi:hypothetical protein